MAFAPHPIEAALEPDLPIIDPHHHLNYAPGPPVDSPESEAEFRRLYRPVGDAHRVYLFEHLLADVASGHNVRATVYVQAGTMYRAAGPARLRNVGEIEYVAGVAAMSESGLFGEPRLCAGIVGSIDPSLGAGVEEVLLAQIAAAGGRYRGVRLMAVHAHPSVWGFNAPEGMLADTTSRAAFARLEPLGLSLEVGIVEPQLPEVLDLARAMPETSIILGHLGSPVGIGIYRGRREERFPIWRAGIRALAELDNVTVKLGGQGNPMAGFATFRATPPATSEQLAADWRPYIETCIEAFGADRCMFESNYPPDSGSGSYVQIWNAYKRVVAAGSDAEKTALFSGTAARVYRIEI